MYHVSDGTLLEEEGAYINRSSPCQSDGPGSQRDTACQSGRGVQQIHRGSQFWVLYKTGWLVGWVDYH